MIIQLEKYIFFVDLCGLAAICTKLTLADSFVDNYFVYFVVRF